MRIIKAYKLRHSYDVSQFITDYLSILRHTMWIIWSSIEWKNNIPKLPSSNEFKRSLRNELYSILKSWRKKYIKDRAGKRITIIKRRFVKINH